MALERGLEGRDQLLKLVKRHAREIQELHRTGLQLGKPYTCHGSCLLSLSCDVGGASYQKESGINSIIDEADRLKTASLEQVRDIFDQSHLGVVLIGMPGLEKRLSRYPQLYSRVGFVHAFRPLSAGQVRKLLHRKWAPAGVALPEEGVTDEEARAAIIRVTGGNFRLLHRLLTQIARLLEINALHTITRHVVEAARESLVIGTA
jgi:hypothetical protein